MTDLPLEAKRLAVTRYLVFADCVEEDVLKGALQDIVFDFLHEFPLFSIVMDYFLLFVNDFT